MSAEYSDIAAVRSGSTVYTACKILISDGLINKISGINHLLDESAAFQGKKYRARHETALLCFLL